jgi:hypothetical protein
LTHANEIQPDYSNPDSRSSDCSRCSEERRSPLNESLLLWGLLFGSIGLGFFVYGKKQRSVVPLVCGLALMAFPYFVSNTILVVVIGIVLMVIPYFLRI